MLEKVRKNVKSFGIQAIIFLIVAAFIGTIFLVWGHGGKQERQGTVLAKVYGADITYPEYQQEFFQLVQQYRNMYKEKWSDQMIEQLQIRKVAFDNLVNHYIFFHKAIEWGINVSREEVTEYIKTSIPVFQANGTFNPQIYERFLAVSRMSPEQFEQNIQRYLLQNRIQERVVSGFKVTDRELMEDFGRKNEKVRADYLAVTIDRFTANVKLGLEELRGYYDLNQDKYRYEERRSVEYLFVSPRDYEKDATVTDEEIEDYYHRHESQFLSPHQVKASHILFTVSEDASAEQDAAIKEKALDVLERIKKGEDFHALAKTYSACPSAQRGGDLGYFGKGKMDPAFEKVAFSLGVGEVSQVVRSSFGYHLIKVEDVKPEHVRPLGEVKDQIVRVLKAEKGKELARLKIEELVRRIYKGSDIREFAFEDRVTYKAEGPLMRGQPIPGISRDGTVMEAIFALEPEQISRIIETPKGFLVFRLSAIEPPRPMAYEEVETMIEQDLKREKARDLAREEAENIRRRLLSGAGMAAVAKEYGIAVSDTGMFGRGEYMSGLGVLDDRQAQVMFSLKPGEFSPVIETERGFAIFTIKDKQGVDEEAFARQRDFLKAQLLQVRQQELFTTWIERIKKSIPIEVYNKDFEGYIG